MSTIPSQVHIEADLAVTSSRGLNVTYKVKNSGQRHVYVYDRLWTLDKASLVVEEKMLAYRYLVDKTYRIHLGSAPLPRSKTTFMRNAPYVTYVAPHAEYSRTIKLEPPWREHNFYYDTRATVPENKVDCSEVELVIDFLEVDSPVETEATSLGSDVLKVLDLALVDKVSRWRSQKANIMLDVLQRQDEFERLDFPKK